MDFSISLKHEKPCTSFRDFGCGCNYCHDCGWPESAHLHTDKARTPERPLENQESATPERQDGNQSAPPSVEASPQGEQGEVADLGNVLYEHPCHKAARSIWNQLVGIPITEPYDDEFERLENLLLDLKDELTSNTQKRSLTEICRELNPTLAASPAGPVRAEYKGELPELDAKCRMELSQLRTDGWHGRERKDAIIRCRERQLCTALAQLQAANERADREARIAQSNYRISEILRADLDAAHAELAKAEPAAEGDGLWQDQEYIERALKLADRAVLIPHGQYQMAVDPKLLLQMLASRSSLPREQTAGESDPRCSPERVAELIAQAPPPGSPGSWQEFVEELATEGREPAGNQEERHG